MLRDAVDAPGEDTPDELRGAYDERLAETVDRVGREVAVSEADVGEEHVDALLEGRSPSLTVSEAASLLAIDSELPDAAAIEAEARDILLMGMSMAVLDVEAVASGIDDEMEPKEIQQKVEGRTPLDLDEYAILHSYIESQR